MITRIDHVPVRSHRPKTRAALPARALIQRKCACGGLPDVAGECAECRSRRLHGVEAVLHTPGQALSADTRAALEAYFGFDFRHVRVHTDPKAAESARAVQARAYTVGEHIVFGAGQYAPQTVAGQQLLAHELTHVVQQAGAANRPETAPLEISEAHDPAEQEAERLATGFAAHQNTPDGPRGKPSIAFFQPIRTIGRTVIQRLATWVAGPVHATNNAAIQIIKGGEAGATPPVLNTQIIHNNVDAYAAFNKPTIDYANVLGGGAEAWVAKVPDNIGSFDETTLSPGPWTTQVQLTTARTLVRQPQCAGTGWSQFTVNGIPSDADLAAANRAHEDRHARDHQIAFQHIFIWDREMTRLMQSGQRFPGPDIPTCKANLFAAVGGTPREIVDTFMDTAVSLRDDFHATPAGADLKPPFNKQANANCSTSSMDLSY